MWFVFAGMCWPHIQNHTPAATKLRCRSKRHRSKSCRAMSSFENLFCVICLDSPYELSYCTRYKKEHLYFAISIISSVYYLICNTQTTATQCKNLGSGGNPNILHFPNYYSINFMVHLLYYSESRTLNIDVSYNRVNTEK